MFRPRAQSSDAIDSVGSSLTSFIMSHRDCDGNSAVPVAGNGFRIHSHTPTLVSILHLSATLPLILSIPACLCKTVQTNFSPVSSQFVIVHPCLQEIPTSSASLTNKHAPMLKANSPAWPARSAGTSVVQPPSSENWHNVCTHILSFVSQSH
jgi:hypothetical protein